MTPNNSSIINHCRLLFTAFLIATLSLVAVTPAQADKLRMVNGESGLNRYAKGLLHLIESKLEQKFEWDETTEGSTASRITQMLADDQLDIVWYATVAEFEEKMRPIRIPIYKGLLGYRIFMIKKGNQSKFDGIKTLDDLKSISIGQGHLWADTLIMEANGINVTKVTQYARHFYMLDGDRFLAFPRGVHEPWAEIANYPELELTVEKNLLMAYTNPFYFFVRKDNKALADKIERGFRRAIEDGSFDKYFLADPTINDVLTKANMQNRTVIRLKNPTLPPLTPVEDETLWFDPYKL